MKTINLRGYYPFYTQETFLEVPDEVAASLAEAERQERNFMRRMFYNKAQYSLDAEDGIEASATECLALSPEALLDLMERHCHLCRALNELPELQGRRVEAHYLLGKSVQEIATAEGVGERNVRKSIQRGLERMKKFLKKLN